MVQPIKIGEEVRLRGLRYKPVGVVTLNTTDHFCVITKEGYAYNVNRLAANPLKTGKKYDVEGFLRSMQV